MAPTTNDPPVHLHAYSDAPEVVPHQEEESPGLETVAHSTLEPAQQDHSTLEPHPGSYDTSPELWKQGGGGGATTPTPASPKEDTRALGIDGHQGRAARIRSRRRRRKWLVLGGVAAVLAVVGIVLGCVPGLRKKGDASDG
jgi:hypothetical protein